MTPSKKSIPFFNYQGVYAEHETEYEAALKDVLRRGAFILQRDLEEFEKNLAEYLGVKHAFGVANCTDALILALRCAGIKPGDEVILSSHTFIATAAAVHFTGGIPVPVECGSDHMIDPESVEAAITPRTRILMPTQVNGRTCDMDALAVLAKKHDLKIVEDSAQALGSKFRGRFAGTFGVAGSFSFYPAKVLNCFGDGGAMITDDDRVAEQIFALRDHGRDRSGRVAYWGINSRLDNLQAAVLNVNLKHYDASIAKRRRLASLYDENLRDLPGVKLPPPPDSDPAHFDIFQNYEIEADNRDALKDFLKQEGIGTLIQWGGTPVHQFRELGFTQKLPRTDRLFTRCLMLPMNPMLTEEDVRTIAGAIRRFYKV